MEDPQREQYVYTYTYQSDGDGGQTPQSNTVKVTTTVEEETTPDGTKVVRKKEESQQVSKVTKIQTITRVHRHLIDPITGEIIRQDDPRYQALINEYGEPNATWSDEQVFYEGNGPTNGLTTSHVSTTTNGISPTSSQHKSQERTRSRTEESSSARSSQRSTHRQHEFDQVDHRTDRSTYADIETVMNNGTSSSAALRRKGVSPLGQGNFATGLSGTDKTIGRLIDPNENRYSNGTHSSGRTSVQKYAKNTGTSTNGYTTDIVTSTTRPADMTRYLTNNEPENNKISNDEQIIDYDPNDPNLVDEPYLDVENPYEGLGPGREDIGRGLTATAGRQSPDSIGHAPPGYSEDYGTLSRLYAPYGGEDDFRNRSPSIDTEFREQRWRDPDLQEVIEYLAHTSDVIKENAAAYLQHLCYNDDGIKAKTRALNGIAYLVALLEHEKSEIQKNACGALRNLCYGKRNDENKLELKNRGGIPALIRLLRRTPFEDVREAVTAVLWNASSSVALKGQILDDGLMVLVKNIIIPFSGWDPDPNQRLNPQGKFPAVFKNATGILRNCSSADYDGRRKMRDCDGFIPALLHAVNSSLQSNEIDNKSIENCMCILRNLSYKLQEIIDRDYDKNYPAMAAAVASSTSSSWSVNPTHHDDKIKTGCMGSKRKPKQLQQQQQQQQQYLQNQLNNRQQREQSREPPSNIYAILAPREGRPVELLWQTDVIGTYVHLLRHSSNPDTLEATAGCIQNLTACYWKPSNDLRAEVRKARGLPELVDLLHVDECDAVVNVSAIALRNLAIDPTNREVLGTYAMKDLIDVLPKQTDQRRRHSDETIASVLAAINEIIRVNDAHAKSLFEKEGVQRMIFIMNSKPHTFNSKVIKYTAHVLSTMWKHRSLQELYKKHGYKESDFIHHRLLNSKSLTSSPQSTLHRPRGDLGQPTSYLSKGKQIVRPQKHGGGEEYRMRKMNQSVENLPRPYGDGILPTRDPHADLYATVHKHRPQQVQSTWDHSTSPDSWV
ncbi:unnamed protein product [Didymodactylos carnosus]|uniref:Catenin delta-2 n=1 Tax=Didymodactylos carnosus TaxID=1234261 RepID=A0A813SDC4_9BILA|nr:unnamed protein product [Didymodactylos carnosus]CAF0793799.1 unnamed protein product [Didymodactylos carnosus]CAF3557845.1 unnamed protein product [Didymodactylos carnosus]CAF3578233.1 unnamed protein product [Didymodactylos carnosus]